MAAGRNNYLQLDVIMKRSRLNKYGEDVIYSFLEKFLNYSMYPYEVRWYMEAEDNWSDGIVTLEIPAYFSIISRPAILILNSDMFE